MSVNRPGIYHTSPQSIAGMEGMCAKMWDPPTDSPATPELLKPTNPVPAFMASAIPGCRHVPAQHGAAGPAARPDDSHLGRPQGYDVHDLPGRRQSLCHHGTYPGADHPGAPGGDLPRPTQGTGRRPTPSTGTASSPPP